MKQKLLIVALLAFIIVCVVADPFTFSDTRPLPGDLKIVRLQKWYQRLGGTPDNRDDEQTLLEKIVPIAGSGGTGIADGDKGDVVVSGSGTIWSLDTSGVTAGTYGSASYIPQIVLDSKGRVTSITTNAVSGGGGGSAPVGTVINTVASTAGQIAVFSDTTKTNVVPSSGVTNLTLTTPTVDAGVFTTSARLPNGASVTTASVGMIGFDNDVLASGHGAFQYTDGTLTELLLGIDAASTFTDGFVPTWVAASKKFTLQAQSGGSGSQTPWTSDINGNGKNLTNVLSIDVSNNGIHTNSSVTFFGSGDGIGYTITNSSNGNYRETLPGSGVSGLVLYSYSSSNVTRVATATSAQLATLLSDESGTGALLFAGGAIGAATATSLNKMAITSPATSSTLAVADGKTFTVNNTVTIAGTDSTTITLPAATATVLSSAGGEINAYTSKGTPIGADLIVLEDSAASNAKKKATLATISNPAITTLTDGATITWTVNTAFPNQYATVTLGGNRTLAFASVANSMNGTLIVKQDGTGSRTLTLPSGSKVVSGGAGAITLTATASAVDILTWFTPDGGTTYYWNYGKNYN